VAGELLPVLSADEYLCLSLSGREAVDEMAALADRIGESDEAEIAEAGAATMRLARAVASAVEEGLLEVVQARLAAVLEDDSTPEEFARRAHDALLALGAAPVAVLVQAFVAMAVFQRDEEEARILSELLAGGLPAAADLEAYAAHLESLDADPVWVRKAQALLEGQAE